jgi:hypothetical protein
VARANRPGASAGWVHAKYREITPIILSGVLGVLMAFIVYGRMVLKPIF